MNGLVAMSTSACLVFSLSTFAQARDWTTELSKDGATTVKYDLIKEEKGVHCYYMAQTTANVTLEELDIYLSNTAHHKNFIGGTSITEEIQKLSENEWLAYYYFDAPWPLSNSDLVIRLTRTEEDNKLIFTAKSFTSDYKKSDTPRMTKYQVIYEFEKLDESTTKITYNANYLTAVKVPKFLLTAWFPEGPAGIVRDIGVLKKSD